MILTRLKNAIREQNWFAVVLEVLIVVVGVAIGFQVTAWGNERAYAAREVKMLNELLVNLRADSVDHFGNQEFWKRVERSSFAVAEGLDDHAPWADSMEAHYGWLLNSGIANLNTSAYDNLKSLGLDLISTDSLRAAISNHYTVTYDRLTQYDRDLGLDQTVNLIAPVVLKRMRIVEQWQRAVPLDYEALLDDLEFREIVRFKAQTASWMTYVYDSPIRSTNQLIDMIESELQERGVR